MLLENQLHFPIVNTRRHHTPKELTWSCVESNAFLGHSKAEVASLVPQMVKNLPVMWEIWVRSLDWEDPLEEGMATHSNILSWETEEPGGLQSMG